LTESTPQGNVYLLDKRRGITSRKASREVAASFGYSRYGHAGTLDPDATGVLVVLLGGATRLSRFLTGQSKRYSFVLRLGRATDTDDDCGRLLFEKPAAHITSADVTDLIESRFQGLIEQRVPRYSAVRVDGKRAFVTAREGDSGIDMPSRSVTVTDWRIGTLADCRMELSVTVSPGTYIRALARDIGECLETGGIAMDIRRTASGEFSVEECSSEPDTGSSLLSMASAMRGFSSLSLDLEFVERLRHGASVPGAVSGTAAILDPDGRLIAVGSGDGKVVKPICVLTGGR